MKRGKKSVAGTASATRARGDGFAQQHMIVVPGTVRAKAAKHALLRGVLVTDAGHFSRAKGHRVERVKGAETHLILLCLRGRGWLRTAGAVGEIAVEPGDLAWLPAGVAHAYGADEQDPWSITWAHCTGHELEAWRKHLGEPDPVLRLPTDRLAELQLDAVHGWLERGYGLEELVAAGNALRAALAAAARLARMRSGAARPAEERVAAARERIRQAPERAYALRELAEGAGLSVPHFSQLFRCQTGYPPIDYLIRARIQKACQLLDATTRAVAEVAAEVGYEDSYYFTRCFRRVMGASPRAYRQWVKG